MEKPGTKIQIRLSEQPVEVKNWVRQVLNPAAPEESKEKVILQMPKQPFVHVLKQKNDKI